MFIELVDTLRCPRAHEETWLVARIDRLDGRHIVAGSLGCPICRAQYPIAEGILDMRDAGSAGADSEALGQAGPLDDDTRSEAASVVGPPNDDDVARAAALLGLTEPGGVVVLSGDAGVLADRLEQLASVNLMLVQPTPHVSRSAYHSIVLTSGRLPLAAGAAKGVLVDSSTATPTFLDDAQRALSAGGRLIAPAGAPLPRDVQELARDEREWVAVKRERPSGMVTLARR